MIIGIVGATATGKSSLALALGQALGGAKNAEIVAADAMTLYQGMDIGTAKVSPDERRGIPHHQLDVLEVQQEASVAAYQKHARDDIDKIQSRGRHALIVGGSGLYIRAALDRFEFPPTDPLVRARLEEEILVLGAASLHERLNKLDPQAATNIAPENERRLIRALEAIELTGRPFSATLPQYEYHKPTIQFGVELEQDHHDELIAQRTNQMFAEGFVAEVEALRHRGLEQGKTASRATGYRQILRALRGEMSVEEAREDTITATRRLARNQRKWFRRDPRINRLDGQQNTDRLVSQMLEKLRAVTLG